jgi:hypothetical protein
VDGVSRGGSRPKCRPIASICRAEVREVIAKQHLPLDPWGMRPAPELRRHIPARDMAQLRIMLHLRSTLRRRQRPMPVDGNHAIYHHELRTTLEQIGLNVTAATDYSGVPRSTTGRFVLPC